MQRENHNRVRRPVLVLREHDSVWAPEAKAGVLAAAEAIHCGLAQAGYHVIPVQIESPQALLVALSPFNPARYVVFNWYEGTEPGAEDAAQVTALLDELGFVYTGADTLALRMTQDKIRSNHILQNHGIPTPEGQPAAAHNLDQWNRYPAIVKLATEHGSECLTTHSVVHDEEGLRAQVDELTTAGIKSLMVSEFVQGREFTVSLWGNGTLQALPLLEVEYSAYPEATPRIRSFDAKWETASDAYQTIKLVSPQDISKEQQNLIERFARETYRAFGLRDYGRIDIRFKDATPNVIDVNSNPDITADSSFVLAAHLARYDYSAMLDRIVRLAIHRAGAAASRT